jgi:hypothetical protein
VFGLLPCSNSVWKRVACNEVDACETMQKKYRLSVSSTLIRGQAHVGSDYAFLRRVNGSAVVETNIARPEHF